MKNVFSSLLIIVSATILASCGQSHNAKANVKAFMKSEMRIEDFDVLTWSNMNSTSRLTDSMLTSMRNAAEKEKMVKANPEYTKRTDKLNFITVKYVVGKDTLMNTFYLDDKLQGVVGVKKDAVISR